MSRRPRFISAAAVGPANSLEVEAHRGHHPGALGPQGTAQGNGRLVVEQVFPAMAGHEHRQYHRAELMAILAVVNLELAHKVEHRID